MAVHDLGVNDVYDGIACRMPETLRELRNLVHLLDFSPRKAAEIIRHCGYVCKVAHIKPRLAAGGP